MFVFTCLQVSLHPYILIFSGLCALVCITASSYPQVSVCLLVTSCPHILLPLCSCSVLCYAHLYWYPDILISSYPQVHLLRVVVGILTSSQPHSLVSCTPDACQYPCILTSSYPQFHVLRVLVGILASSHSHIFRFMYYGCLLVSSHPHILMSLVSCTPGACWYPRIFTSSYPQVHVLHVLVDNLASSHPHIANVSSCLENWNQIKTMVLTKKIPAFIEANNGSNKFLTK